MTATNEQAGNRAKGNGAAAAGRGAEATSASPEQFQSSSEAPGWVDPALGFNFEGHAVRIVLQDGEPWFVAADVCRAMQLSADKRSYAAHLEKLDADERRQVDRGAVLKASPGFTPGRRQIATQVTSCVMNRPALLWHRLSIGTQKGPPIGVQKGPLSFRSR